MNLRSTTYLASFDVQSLFTNIPLDETIDLVCNVIFESQTTFHNMSAVFIELSLLQRLVFYL